MRFYESNKIINKYEYNKRKGNSREKVLQSYRLYMSDPHTLFFSISLIEFRLIKAKFRKNLRLL